MTKTLHAGAPAFTSVRVKNPQWSAQHRLWLVLLLVLQLLPQIVFHRAVGLGTDIRGSLAQAGGPGVPVGLIYGVSDGYSYASWAMQAEHGHLLMSDAFTTAPHKPAFFNPYFIMCGALARLTGLMPLTIITILGILSGPLLLLGVCSACATMRVSPFASLLATAFVGFGTGPSLAIVLANIGIFPVGWALRPGIDCSYFDLFPATTLITAPYQAFCLALTAAGLALAVHALRLPGGGARSWRLLWAGLATALLVLIRPYQLAGLASSLVLAWLVSGFAGRRSAADWKIEAVLLATTIGPAFAYVALMSRQNVWREISFGYALVHVPTGMIVTGFALFWAIAALGILRAARARCSGLLLPAVWSLTSAFSAALLGNAVLKFTDGACIPFAILGAFGLEPWLRGPIFPRRALAMAAAALLFGTTAYDVHLILRMGLPEIDANLVTAALFVQQPGTPLVLTDCGAGNLLPGLAPIKVFAGHWALTPGYRAKCHLLEQAGIDASHPGAASEGALKDLLVELRPNYVLIRNEAPAYGWMQKQEPALWHGERWTLFKLHG